MAKKKSRKGGRKANEWSLVTFADIVKYLEKSGQSQTAFAKAAEVTSSTFHNWKTNRCAPDEATQGRIVAVITGKEVSVPKAKKKIKKVTARGSRGAGSSTLAALSGAQPPKVAKAKKKSKKKSKKIAKSEGVLKSISRTPQRRLGPGVHKPRVAKNYSRNGNGNGNSLEGWNNLKALAKFLKANNKRSPDDVKHAVEQINAARKLAEIFA